MKLSLRVQGISAVLVAMAAWGCADRPTGIVRAVAQEDGINAGAARNVSAVANALSVEVNASDAMDLYRKLLHPAYTGRTLSLKGRYRLSNVSAQAALDQLHADGITEQ